MTSPFKVFVQINVYPGLYAETNSLIIQKVLVHILTLTIFGIVVSCDIVLSPTKISHCLVSKDCFFGTSLSTLLTLSIPNPLETLLKVIIDSTSLM